MEVSPKSQGTRSASTEIRCSTDLGAPTAFLSPRADFSVPWHDPCGYCLGTSALGRLALAKALQAWVEWLRLMEPSAGILVVCLQEGTGKAQPSVPIWPYFLVTVWPHTLPLPPFHQETASGQSGLRKEVLFFFGLCQLRVNSSALPFVRFLSSAFW